MTGIPQHSYRPLIERICADHAPVPPNILEAMIWTESNFVPSAKSASNALGLGQVIYRWHGVNVDKAALELGKKPGELALYDPEVNITVAVRHLRWCYSECGNWVKAVRKYHSGSCSPPPSFQDGQGTSSDAHIKKFLANLAVVEAKRSSITPKEPIMALNFDPSLVPMPPYEHRWALNKKDGHGQSNFGTRVHRGISWHRGVTGKQTLDNAVGYLIAASTAGLTDGYIDNNTGRLVFMNPMKALFADLPAWWEDRAGWANGPYQSSVAAPDAKAFVAKYGGRIGASIVNQDLESFEVLGNYGTSISDKCKRTMAQIGANRAQRKKIPWDRYPINPHTGLTEIYGHREFCGTSYKECPGSVVWAFINGDYIAMVQDILKRAQTTGVAVQPAPVVPTPAPEIVIPQPDINLMAELFGGADGFAYDPKGVVTAAWMDEGEKSGLFPRLLETIVDDNVRSFVFSSGLVLQNEIGTGNVTRLDAA